MSSGLYQLGQVAFALVVLSLIGERCWFLLWRAPVSPQLMRFLADRANARDEPALGALARRTPHAFVSRVVLARVEPDEEPGSASPDLLRMELSHLAGARLAVLRGCATLASALGLLGGILAIRRGFGDQRGLLALQAGLAEQVALAEALQMMALGVGTSAICFHALGVFRRAAREALSQSTQMAHLLAWAARGAPRHEFCTRRDNPWMRQALPSARRGDIVPSVGELARGAELLHRTIVRPDRTNSQRSER